MSSRAMAAPALRAKTAARARAGVLVTRLMGNVSFVGSGRARRRSSARPARSRRSYGRGRPKVTPVSEQKMRRPKPPRAESPFPPCAGACNHRPVSREQGGGVTETEAALKALMLLGLDGDAPAYRLLLSQLGGRLRVYFERRMRDAPGDVEDLVQETLMAVHTRRAPYDRAQPFTPWAFALARYKLIDHWRRRKVRATTPIDDYIEVLAAYAPE